MDSRAGLTSWDEQGIGRYVAERRQALDEFLGERFSLRGTWSVFWATLRHDLIRHPLNFILSLPKLFIARIANVVEKFGWYSAARVLQSMASVLRSGFETARKQQIVDGLIGASDEPEIRGALEAPLTHFMAARAAIMELASGGLTIAVAYSLFGSLWLTPYEMGQKLAAKSAREDAASRFFLGKGIGSAFYDLFPPHPTWGQIATWSAGVLLVLGVLTAMLNLLSDPLQQALGVHRRQLDRLLHSFEDNLLLQAARRPRGSETAAELGSPPAPVQGIGAKRLAKRKRLPSLLDFHASVGQEVTPMSKRPSIRESLASVSRKVFQLPNQFVERVLPGARALARRIEARIGRRYAVLASVVAVCLIVLAGGFIKQRFDPYAPVRALVERRAYLTAVARLQQMPTKKDSKRSAEYWYWRGRALSGSRQLDGAMEAYHSAIAKDARYQSDSSVIRDAIEAVATKNHERAKRLILEEIGPAAIEPLREKAVAREDIQRWALVDLIKKLGGEDHINYAEIAVADLACSTTCPAKKRAVEKIIEYRAGDAISALRDLEGQPQYKCLQGVLKQALATLDH